MKNKDYFRSTLDYMLEGCQIIGFDWKYIYLNKTAETHNRRSNIELKGRRYQDMWPGIEQTEVFGMIADTLHNRIPHHFENKFLFPDGTAGWFDLSIQPIPEGVFILSIDITERKITEEKLRENEEKYRLLSDNSDDWIFWVTPDGKYKYISPSVERMTGYRPQEFEENLRLNLEIVHPDDAERVKAHHHFAHSNQVTDRIEYRIFTKDGRICWINHTCTPMFAGDGEYLGQRATNRNITERKLNEELLVESESRFRKLFEDGPFGMALVSSEFKFLKVNFLFTQMLGYSEEELRTFTFNELTHPEDRDKDMPFVKKLISNELHVYKTEKRYIRKDGKVIWAALTVTSNFNNEGKFLYNVAIVEDITRKKHNEEELRWLNDRIATATKASSMGIWDWDVVKNKLDWDDQMYALYGISKEDFPGAYEAWLDGLHPDDRRMSDELAQMVLKENKEYHAEYRVVWPDGSIHWLRAAGQVFYNQAGEPVRMIGVNFDITDQKVAQEELRRSEESYRNIFESSVIGIYRTSPSGQILMANPTLIRMLGYDSFEALVQRDLEHEGFENKEARNNFKEKIKKLGAVFGLESVWRTRDGKPVVVSENAKAFYDGDGKVIYYEGTIEDITERKKIESSLKESEERFRKAFATNPDSITISRVDNGMYVSVNDGFEAIMGYTEEEVLGRTSVELGLWPDPAKRKDFTEALKSEGFVKNFEVRLIAKGGEIKDALASATFIEVNGEKHILSTVKDITELKRVEEALRSNEALLKEVGEIAKVGGWEFSTITGDANWTEEVARIHDLDPETPASVALSVNYYSDESRPIIEKAVQDAVELGKSYDLELEIVSAKGIRKWIRTIGRPVFENDKIVKVHGSFQDITERKKVENDLRESELRFRTLLESLPIPVTYVTSDGLIAFRNARFLQVFGYSEEEVPSVSEWWIKAYPDEDYRQWVISNWDAVIERANNHGGDIDPFEYQITCKDGAKRIVVVSGILINDITLVTFVDITDRKRAEKEVLQLNETLEQRIEERTNQLVEANKELESFSYSVSHDLRAPLRHINGYVDLLLERYREALPDKAQHYLGVIVKASQQMGNLIDDLLQFSRTGRQELKLSEVDMRLLVKESIGILGTEIKDRNIEWNIGELPVVIGDYALLRHVWINLIGNAVKFTGMRDQAIITIGSLLDDSEIKFYVKDNGAGFDMRYINKLFGVFQRLHSNQEFEGTGIGLANVRKIISRHGGKTWAESELNKGANFYFTIPVINENRHD